MFEIIIVIIIICCLPLFCTVCDEGKLHHPRRVTGEFGLGQFRRSQIGERSGSRSNEDDRRHHKTRLVVTNVLSAKFYNSFLLFLLILIPLPFRTKFGQMISF